MKQYLRNFLLKNVFNMVVLDDVIETIVQPDRSVKIFIGGKEIGDSELRQLIAEAKALEGFSLWKIINETIKNEALKTGWTKSTSIDELNTGKTIYHILDVQNSIIRIIRNKEKKV